MSADRDEFSLPFLLLSGVFISALVTCNLIANKFVTVDLGFKVFTVSAGILPYPVTFLVTDLLSELYGRRRANRVVIAGFFASVFALVTLLLGAHFPAIPGSPVDQGTYDVVFQNTGRIIAASMIAYLAAQFVDIRLFHFWKDLTRGRHLWLRNNASTITSQLLDSVLVVGVIFAGKASAGSIFDMVVDAWIFKVICALLDTPFIYGVVIAFRRYAPTAELLHWEAARSAVPVEDEAGE